MMRALFVIVIAIDKGLPSGYRLFCTHARDGGSFHLGVILIARSGAVSPLAAIAFYPALPYLLFETRYVGLFHLAPAAFFSRRSRAVRQGSASHAA